ncbi:hypothetical protein SAMN04488577_3916 [Bacillus sp. cl95]|uniref:hypothetical protein n=1 Tax=Bacillus sp. UNCCL13 TaxID=1502772 RepID=UPI0008DF595B|nr:hypothetical protein [Bacillus sp. UNCCL13]SFB20489.1 hypothetical protein SAMN02799634_108101 [Bacillus sp. UNCCL13]SFQ90877.1 hypothetical protein SAMN04488577_3916 [Bacillus sp. cl95]
MYHDYETIAQLQRQQIEKASRHAWKYQHLNEENFFQKLFNKRNKSVNVVANSENCCTSSC